MLGWEFPPVINGGLGVACFGLSKAMTGLVDLSLIIPKTAAGFVVENLELIGLNQLTIEQFKNQGASTTTTNTYDVFKEVTFVEADFAPYKNYASKTDVTCESTEVISSKNPEVTQDDILSFESVGDIYGTDIWDKIQNENGI